MFVEWSDKSTIEYAENFCMLDRWRGALWEPEYGLENEFSSPCNAKFDTMVEKEQTNTALVFAS